MAKQTYKIAIILALIISIMSPALVSAAPSAGIKPGSFFYFFDTTFEKVGLFFTFSPEKKAQKALEYASERLAEVQAIEEEKNPDAIKTAITNYESNVALATEKSKEVKDKGQAENLFNLISDNASKNQEVLSAVLIKVPEEAKEAIMRAIEMSRKNQEEATKQITELKSEIEKLKKEVEELKAKEENKESKEIKESEIKPQLPSSQAPELNQQENLDLKIAKCQAIKQSSYDNTILKINEEFNLKLQTSFNDLNQKRITEINKLYTQEPYSSTGSELLTGEQKLSLLRNDSTYKTEQGAYINQYYQTLWYNEKKKIEDMKQQEINKINQLLSEDYYKCLSQ